jgi:type III pantothenate kinase|tara:strand:- start:1478 stop:2422 length:945 start_codon:yes stop_codon:yes gene_type:complete
LLKKERIKNRKGRGFCPGSDFQHWNAVLASKYPEILLRNKNDRIAFPKPQAFAVLRVCTGFNRMTDLTNILLLDAGNTSVKWKLGSAGELHRCEAINIADLELWMREHISEIKSLALSSVQGKEWNATLQSICSELGMPLWVAQSELENSGLTCGYHEPVNLGVDRWLAMLALWQRQKSGFLLVDMGSAITLDAVDDKGRHLGGYILPGLEMQRRALMATSESIGILLAGEADFRFGLGLDTSEAIDRGIFISVEAMVEKVLNNTGLSQDQLVIIGGDARWFIENTEINNQNIDLVIQGLAICYSQKLEAGELT